MEATLLESNNSNKLNLIKMEFRVSKKDCQDSIDKSKRVCSRCGGKRTALQTVDNSGNPTHWEGCDSCCVFDYGVDKDVFEIANILLDVNNIHSYHYDDVKRKGEEGYDYWRQGQISGLCSMIYAFRKCEEEVKTKNTLKRLHSTQRK